MYLAKPLRAHTLFQAVCRTNRRWTNPHTGQAKLHGLVVDYLGLGGELARAVAVRDTGAGRALPPARRPAVPDYPAAMGRGEDQGMKGTPRVRR